MKTCVYCGKSLADYATHCKYCDRDLPAEPLPSNFQCNSCGSPLAYEGEGVMVQCEVCGNSVVVPPALREAMQATHNEPTTLSAQVESLVQAGRTQDAFRLLREQANLRTSEAEAVIAIITSGQYGDVQQVILQAQRGELPS